MTFLKLLAAALLSYSALGVLLHLFFKLGYIGHYCHWLVGAEQEHLLLFTVAASLSGLLFSLLKRKRRKANLPKP